MKARVRVGVLIFKRKKILLVKHVNPISGEEFWVTPGGGVKKEDKNIFVCGMRETYEETGLYVKLSKKIKFVREWYDTENEKIQLELFLLAKEYSGEMTIDNIKGCGADEEWIKELKFLGEKEMKNLNIFPSFLKNPNELLKKMKKGAIYLE